MIERLGLLKIIPNDLSALLGKHNCVQFEYEHLRPYLKQPDSLKLNVALSRRNHHLECLIAETFPDEAQNFNDLSASLQQQPIKLNGPLLLDPVYISKPWGREIWFSGIEDRGISSCEETPIAWLFDIFGKQLGCEGFPLLLKILDPLAEENIGDLYFELHTEKVEVYVVTHVDRSAWPDGIGYIRYGFNQTLLKQYESPDLFLFDYRAAVKNYEQIRREIDAGASGLAKTEAKLRKTMYCFTDLQPIMLGDVITVEPFMPHSLMHGVRVVEFQTPHYERYILSFGQKVITQDHWDTDEALKVARLDGYSASAGANDIIADFDRFQVERLEIPPGQTRALSADRYQIIMGIAGKLSCDTGERLSAESAWFIPPREEAFEIRNKTKEPSVFLRARETPPT